MGGSLIGTKELLKKPIILQGWMGSKFEIVLLAALSISVFVQSSEEERNAYPILVFSLFLDLSLASLVLFYPKNVKVLKRFH